MLTPLVARPWCLMAICTKQEIINLVTDPHMEKIKLGFTFLIYDNILLFIMSFNVFAILFLNIFNVFSIPPLRLIIWLDFKPFSLGLFRWNFIWLFATSELFFKGFVKTLDSQKCAFQEWMLNMTSVRPSIRPYSQQSLLIQLSLAWQQRYFWKQKLFIRICSQGLFVSYGSIVIELHSK